MAPNPAPSTVEFIHGMIMSNEFTPSQMAKAAGCNESTTRWHVYNLRLFGHVKASRNNANLTVRSSGYVQRLKLSINLSS